MSKRVQLVLEKIGHIEQAIEKAGGITLALEDEAVFKPAVLMHLVSIAEQFQKMQNDMDFELLAKFDKADIRGALAVRNFIAHDYEGVNLGIVEEVIRHYLPKIKQTILMLS
jgi:uncharacterized protein with HEPN domain